MSFNLSCKLTIQKISTSDNKAEPDIRVYRLPCNEAISLLRQLDEDERSLSKVCSEQNIVLKCSVLEGKTIYKYKNSLSCESAANKIEQMMTRSKL